AAAPVEVAASPADATPAASAQAADAGPGGAHLDRRPIMVIEELTARTAAARRPPPPGSPARKSPSPIELLKEAPRPASDHAEGLVPGTLVIGPPPATRPERDLDPDDLELPPVAPVTILPTKKRTPAP